MNTHAIYYPYLKIKNMSISETVIPFFHYHCITKMSLLSTHSSFFSLILLNLSTLSTFFIHPSFFFPPFLHFYPPLFYFIHPCFFFIHLSSFLFTLTAFLSTVSLLFIYTFYFYSTFLLFKIIAHFPFNFNMYKPFKYL